MSPSTAPTTRLAGIAAAINSATGNPGITATVLQGTDGAHLLLSSSLTGAGQHHPGHRDRRRQRPGRADLRHAATPPTTRRRRQPQDASFSIAGVAYTSPSNTVTDALSGVTLNLVAPTGAGSNATLSVSNDTRRSKATSAPS